MNKLRHIALLAAALLSGLSAFGQRLPDTTVNWETEVVTAADGTSRIVFTGTPVGVGPVHINDRLQGFLEGEKLFDFKVK